MNYVIGDLHGSLAALKALEEKLQIGNNDFVFLLGDLRRIKGRTKKQDTKNLSNYIASKYRKQFGMPGYYVIRGNHDHFHNPYYDYDFGEFYLHINSLPEIMEISVSTETYILAHAGLPVEDFQYSFDDLIKRKIIKKGEQFGNIKAYHLIKDWQSNEYKMIVGESGKIDINMKFYQLNRSPILDVNTYIIHGHYPTSNLNNLYNYKAYETENIDSEYSVLYAETKKVFDIDTGSGYQGNVSLSCIRLEDRKCVSVKL